MQRRRRQQNRRGVEENMRRLEPTLAALDSIATTTGLVTDGVNGGIRELFHTVCAMEGGGQDGPVVDPLIRPVYHALLVSYLSKCAVYASDEGEGAPDEATRRADLDDTLNKHIEESGSLPYTIVGLCDAPRCPATLVTHGTTLYVACRGTRTFPEAIGDLQFDLQPADGVQGMKSPGRVHHGFLTAFNLQAKGVLARIDAVLRDGVVEDVVFCGHSLGGAVAQLLGVAYAQRRGSAFRSLVVSFGCPRVGDAAFRDTLGTHIAHHRLYVKRDPFPALPPRYAPHGGTEAAGVGGWRLALKRQAMPRPAEAPTRALHSLWPFRSHDLTKYAQTLKDHRSLREGMAHGGQPGEVAAA